MKKYAYYAEDAEDFDGYGDEALYSDDFYPDDLEREDTPIPWGTLMQLALRLYVIHKQVDLRNFVRLAGRYLPFYGGLPPSVAAQKALARAAGQLGVPRRRVNASVSRGLSRQKVRQYRRRQDRRPRKRFHARAHWR